VYDIGAHVGFYTLLASKLVGVRGRVIAFEPLPRNLYFLKEHLRLNGCSNVTVIAAAVGDTPGVIGFEEEPSSSMGRVSSAGNLRVSMVTLDDLTGKGDIPPPNYVKIDIEGAEMKALDGARRLFTEFRPTIFLSTHGTQEHSDCCEFLRSHGYELRPIGADSIGQIGEILGITEV
jgi:FkbM family methyltransferase